MVTDIDTDEEFYEKVEDQAANLRRLAAELSQAANAVTEALSGYREAQRGRE